MIVSAMVERDGGLVTLGSVLITYRRHYRAGNFCKTKERGRGKRESGGEGRVGRVIVNSRAGSDGYRSVG